MWVSWLGLDTHTVLASDSSYRFNLLPEDVDGIPKLFASNVMLQNSTRWMMKFSEVL